MSDLLLEVGKRPAARKVLQTLGLPLPLPEPLARPKGPWAARPLEDATIVAGAASGAELITTIASALAEAGAAPFVVGDTLAAFKESGEAYARPAKADNLGEEARIKGLVFDASGVRRVADLKQLYEFFHPRIRQLSRSGRVVVVGRTGGPAEGGPTAGVATARATSPEEAAVQSALTGFVKSVAKEIGGKGATANLIYVEPGAELRAGPVIRWLLEARSAFVTAQPLVVSKRAADGPRPAFVRPLDGRSALVTGAARGIGRATALALAAEGAHVFCVDRPEDGDATSKLARDISGTPILADVTGDPAVIADAVRARGVDILVHNAGITRDKTLARMKPEQWDQVLGVNLAAVLRISEAVNVRDGGRIICLSSIGGIAGNLGQTNYAATKAALIGYVDALSTRLAARGITANAIAPGFIETRMTAAVPMMIREAGRRLSALGQGGLPEDIAQAIVFLASPGAQGISGRTLRVCGGALIGA
jgi:3-oxoacyl-[acyl-carrier protein] reductase